MMKRSLLLLCSFLLFTGCASTASQAETECYTYQSVDTSFVNPLIGYMQNAEETQLKRSGCTASKNFENSLAFHFIS